MDRRYNPEGQTITRVLLPRGEELFGVVEAMLGDNRVHVRCSDNKLRICRIPGKMRKRIWIQQKDVVVIEPWDIQRDSRGDIVRKYRNAEIEWLKRKNILKMEI